VKGQGAIVLTRPGAAQARRAELVFPPGIAFLVLANDRSGAVLGEVGAHDVSRGLSLPPGRFFVRGRGRDYLLEGSLSVAAGQMQRVDTNALDRVEYARLVRKGERPSARSHALELGPMLRSTLPNAETPCLGGLFGYRLELESIGFVARLGACTSSFENEVLEARTNEYVSTLGTARTWDLSGMSLVAGLGVGATLTHQSFDTRSDAPTRVSLAPLGYLAAGTVHPLGHRTYLGLDLRLEGHIIQFQRSAVDDSELRAVAAVRGSTVIGMQF
jgi:hypothetical protein